MKPLIDYHEINHLTQLCKLDFSESEKTHMAKDLATILDFVSELKEFKVEKEAPFLFEGQINIVRERDEEKIWKAGNLLKIAPKKERQFFKVPRIL